MVRRVDLHEVPSSGKTYWPWRCYEPGLLLDLKDVWQKWLGFFSSNTDASIAAMWEDTQSLRHATFLERNLRFLNKDSIQKSGTVTARLYEFIQNHRFSAVYNHCKMFMDEKTLSPEVQSKWKDDLEAHLLTGVFLVGSSSDSTSPTQYRVNPTLFYNEDSYDLHYGTDSF
jgi:hypothetical protein